MEEGGSVGPRASAYLEDVVLGANDGIITSFAIVSGAEGGTLGALVILVLGFANVLADGVSMGASNLLAKRSRLHYTQSQKRQLEREIEEEPQEKRDELRTHMTEQGIDGPDQRVMLRHIERHKKAWLTALVASRADLIEEPGSPFMHGLATLGAFVVAGLFPLGPYLFGVEGSRAFVLAGVLSAAALFLAGALRSPFTGQGWLRSGLEMLAVGSAAGAVAYVVGILGSTFVG